jgi:hypothetical protein
MLAVLNKFYVSDLYWVKGLYFYVFSLEQTFVFYLSQLLRN